MMKKGNSKKWKSGNLQAFINQHGEYLSSDEGLKFQQQLILKNHSEDEIRKVLNDQTKSRWQRVENVAKVTGLTIPDLLRVIHRSGGFVVARDQSNQAVISTRERYRKEEPFLSKLIDAFKNRIE